MSNNHTESRIQQDIFIHYQNNYCLPKHEPNRCLIWHTPNEGQQRLVSIGVLPGVSDLTIVHSIAGLPQGVHIYVEVKTPTGKQSPAQAEFMRRINTLGYIYCIVRSKDEFVATLKAIEQSLVAK